MTGTARAAVLVAPGQPVEMREFPLPRLAPGETLLETLASEVCGTDVHLREGRLAGVPYPLIPGHVSVGRIVESNQVERDASGVPVGPGSVVTFFDVHGACGACHFCLVARTPNRCPSRRVYGITEPAAEGLLGGWAERIWLRAGVRMLALPETLSVDDLIGGGCGLFTGFAAVDRAGIRLAESVAVQGIGPVGLAAIAFARAAGAGFIAAIGEPEARRELALLMGADLALGLDDDQRVEAVRDRTLGHGADVVIEASGNPKAVPEGLAMTRDGGRYVVVGHYTDAGTVGINPHTEINRKHVEIRGQWGSDFHHWRRALDLLERRSAEMPFARVIGKRYRLEEAEQALDDIEALRVTKAILVPGQ